MNEDVDLFVAPNPIILMTTVSTKSDVIGYE